MSEVFWSNFKVDEEIHACYKLDFENFLTAMLSIAFSRRWNDLRRRSLKSGILGDKVVSTDLSSLYKAREQI